ncbi:MAG: hypothetical protein LIO80_10060 [Lachnospiraceae bacterium]|nr:hypothetical protein [Lachnospiraceae bacterium]
MNMRKCAKGHYYDGDVNATCPECAKEMRGGAAYGATEAASGGGFGGIGATEPVSGGGFDEVGATEPVSPMSGGSGGMGDTLPPDPPIGGQGMNTMFAGGGNNGVLDYPDDVTQPITPNQTEGFNPVVGWLVCTDGPDRGNDHRIRAGYNQIGRAEYMDICIRGDYNISREKHALIAYDDQEKTFFFGPSEGKNIVRLNDRMVMMPTEIHPYDILTVGSSKLIFVPLCGEHFDWGR